MGALFTAHHLGAKAIVAMTDSGSTALWMSRHRIHIPIYALTPKVATQRKMALYRNVRPLLMDTSADRDTALEQAEGHLEEPQHRAKGDVYAITCGEPMGAGRHQHAQDLRGQLKTGASAPVNRSRVRGVERKRPQCGGAGPRLASPPASSRWSEKHSQPVPEGAGS